MRNLGNRRMKFARLLLSVYVPMLLAITFHHHSVAERIAVFYCFDCTNDIHHDGHFSPQSDFVQECPLCHLCALPYVVPVLFKIALFFAAVHVVFHVACPFFKTREVSIRSTRAPPVFQSL